MILLTLIPLGIIKLSHLNKMTDNVQYRKELLKPAIKTFKRREVNTFYTNDVWSADIVDLSNLSKYNNGYKYLLTTII